MTYYRLYCSTQRKTFFLAIVNEICSKSFLKISDTDLTKFNISFQKVRKSQLYSGHNPP